MTFTDTVSRIEQIQTQMDTLAGIQETAKTTSTATATSGGAASTGTADSFAPVLSAAKGTEVTATAGTLVDNGTTGQDIVNQARKYIGVPYVFGGTTSAGLDCSGLVQRVYADLGIKMPRLVSGQGSVGVEVPFSDLQPGDIISTKGNEHIVIYAGNGKVIHAPDVGRNVTEVTNWLDPSDIKDIRRIVPTQASHAAPAQTNAASAPQSQALSALLGTSAGAGTPGVSNTQAAQIAALLSLGANTSQLGSLLGSPIASQQSSLAALLAGGSR